MALKQRDIETNYCPKEGAVVVDDFQKNKELAILQKAQENLAIHNSPVYAPNLNDDNSRPKTRLVSYSAALSNLYRSVVTLNNAAKPYEADSPEMKENKEFERAVLQKSMPLIQSFFAEAVKAEYPEATPAITKEFISVKMQGDPQPFQPDEQQRKNLEEVLANMKELSDFMIEKSPNFQRKAMDKLGEYRSYLTDKLDNKEVRLREQTSEDIMNSVQSSVEMLIRDDSQQNMKVDRARAEQDLAKKLDRMGMELVVVYVNENKSPAEELLDQAKTCVLRASWDGFIERPRNTTMCSPALQAVLYKGLPKTDPRTYKFDESPVWNICKQMPAFEELKFKLGEGLAEQGFPADKIKELSYTDIAQILNLKMPRSSQEVEDFQRHRNAVVDGVRIKSGRVAFFKKYAHEHEPDLRLILESQGKSKEAIDGIIQKMRMGKSVPEIDGHHNFAINDPATYEKTTGKNWTQMNDEVKVLDKEPHVLLHMTENNVNAIGKVIRQDAKSSHRTVFKDKNSGQKFYYMVRVKEGIEGVLGLNHETIYNKDYLAGQSFEKPKEEKTAVATAAPIEHAQERLNVLIMRKANQTDSPEKPKAEKNAKQTMSRPNYRGKGAFGGHKTLAHLH